MLHADGVFGNRGKRCDSRAYTGPDLSEHFRCMRLGYHLGVYDITRNSEMNVYEIFIHL